MAFLDITFLGNSLKQILWFIIFIFIGMVVSWTVIYFSKNVFIKLARRSKNKIDDILADILSRPLPLRIVIITIFFNIGFKILNASDWWIKAVKQVSFLVYVFAISLFIIKFLLGLIKEYLQVYAAKTESKYDDQLIPLLRSLIKVVVWIVAVLVVLSNLGYNISALLAGLGIGGLAVAMASKDIVENFLSGIVIFVEKPFKLGDVIKTSDGLGSIEEIGIRSTRVRTFDGTVVVVPNRILSSNALENISKRQMRKETMKLGLVYNTSVAKLEKAKAIVKKIILDNKSTDDIVYVSFDSFGDYSLNISIIYWVKELAYDKYLVVKDNINIEIKKQFEKAGIEFAYPTQTIELKK
ncbi:MAG: mechanosensitive ion channel family protein [archaeon]|nr:mechanosensitive ion channel family protein [archaeon]MDD2477862.1 mechanosensitive ion channel family protein [Candidatus ainarchaeum sp.]MDD3084597.1 mechanosensitive ion channel family protein [Candidatus ainarchaeum sp.]MDD4221114.1 mechanosensitive ion channel family protein [Candidatus ainarchaeum sp.]MDD4662601.1 mechanosensitive ion channel family protein [Candidatus ainarchaeum sp.]